MLRYIIPKIALRDLWPMAGAAICGALVAGVYGVLHDQLTYTISPEYFTKLKFDQFAWANIGLPDRIFVAEIGFLATWWVGFFCAWFIGRRVIPGQPRHRALRRICTGCLIVFVSALSLGIMGFGYGVWRGPDADYSFWERTLSDLDIEHKWPFIRVAYIHNAGYLGGLTGLVLALVMVRPERKASSMPSRPTTISQASQEGAN